jgi:RHS repeat-associated protein
MKEWTLPVNEDLVAALADDFRSGPLLNDHGRRRLEEALVAELNGQRLSSDGVSNYTWDANGSNLTRNGTPGNFTFGYDPDSRLTGITGAATAIYTYDYQGRRSSKTVGGVTTTYLYDGLNLVGETSGATVANYVFGPGVDEPLAQYRAGTLSYFDADGLGTIPVTNDSAGNAILSTSFDAWGVARNEAGTRYHPFAYTAREVGEAGLLFYRARLLQPGVGRFTQEDPESYDRAMSAYFYVRANPVSFRDPTGLRSCKDDIPRDLSRFRQQYDAWFSANVTMWGPLNSIVLSCTLNFNGSFGGGGCGVRTTGLLGALKPDTACCRSTYKSHYAFGIEHHASVDIQCRDCTENEDWRVLEHFDPWRRIPHPYAAGPILPAP